MPVYFSLIIHAHQPVGNFDRVIEEAYTHSYLPFIEQLAKHPAIPVSLHYSGALLEWIEHRHPEFFDRLRALLERDQVELLSGGFYEPILVSIPVADQKTQIQKLSAYLKHHFGFQPRGLWLAERVWEPSLPATLAEAGMEYTAVDDAHFLAAGLPPHQLYGYFLTEDQGRTLKVIPGSKRLRYLIPFHTIEQNLAFLREVASPDEHPWLVMADDCEKFGVWPFTYTHVFTHGWLEKFFKALEQNADWLRVVTAREYLQAFAPRGRIYLPTASYAEMMEWAFPPTTREVFEAARKTLGTRAELNHIEPFLRGGFWRNFLARYSEANRMQKEMWRVSARLHAIEQQLRPGDGAAAEWKRAQDYVLRAQGNDAYWHGIFGGLYAPHLRHAVFENLVRADAALDAFEEKFFHRSPGGMEQRDLDGDGAEELWVADAHFSAWLHPNEGGTVSMLNFKPRAMNVINALRRREEYYHQSRSAGQEAANAPSDRPGGAKTIHESQSVEGADLGRALIYDAFDRHCFRTLAFPREKIFEHWVTQQLEPLAQIAAGRYQLASPQLPTHAPLSAPVILECAENGWHVRKSFSIASEPNRVEILCVVQIHYDQARAESSIKNLAKPFGCCGTEMVLNFLAPHAPDRYFELDGRQEPLEWGGVIENCQEILIVDQYQRTRARLSTSPVAEWWVSPIETVSQSESGLEKTYQGSSILAVWKDSPFAGQALTLKLVLEATGM